MEESVSLFSTSAFQSDISIISACGFDSVPADIGVFYLLGKMLEMNYKPLWVESVIEIENFSGNMIHGHFTTFESAVHGFSSQKTLNVMRQSKEILKPKEEGYDKYLPTTHPKLSRHKWPFFETRIGKWCVPFPSSDPSVVWHHF